MSIDTKYRCEVYGDSIYVRTHEVDFSSKRGLDAAVVSAPSGCIRTLNWEKKEFTWKDLRARASEAPPKGTFWVTEMEEVMREIANSDHPRIMTSTFRGRGGEYGGRIFGPQLVSVKFSDDRPVEYHFIFPEVIVPELVRGRGPIGTVFNLIHIATRARWEVLEPFLGLRRSEEDQRELIGRVSRSLRVIQLEAERHGMLDHGAALDFDGPQRDLIAGMLEETESVKKAIDAAVERGDLDQLLRELACALDRNSIATVTLAERFLDLAREDRSRVERRLPYPVGHVFISYSHKDAEWLQRLQAILEPFARQGVLDLWDDTRLQPGVNWYHEIEKALERASTAILLVSDDFLASNFIATNELPRLLRKAAHDRVQIMSVILDPCDFLEHKDLSRYQAVNSPDHPLTSMERHEADAVLVKLARSVGACGNRPGPP